MVVLDNMYEVDATKVDRCHKESNVKDVSATEDATEIDATENYVVFAMEVPILKILVDPTITPKTVYELVQLPNYFYKEVKTRLDEDVKCEEDVYKLAKVSIYKSGDWCYKGGFSSVVMGDKSIGYMVSFGNLAGVADVVKGNKTIKDGDEEDSQAGLEEEKKEKEFVIYFTEDGKAGLEENAKIDVIDSAHEDMAKCKQLFTPKGDVKRS